MNMIKVIILEGNIDNKLKPELVLIIIYVKKIDLPRHFKILTLSNFTLKSLSI